MVEKDESSEEFEKPKALSRIRSTQEGVSKPVRVPHHLPRKSIKDSLVSQFDWKIIDKLYFSPVHAEAARSVWASLEQMSLHENPKSGMANSDRKSSISKVYHENAKQDSVIVLFVTRTIDKDSNELVAQGILVAFKFTEGVARLASEPSQTSNFRIVPFYKRKELEEELEDIRLRRLRTRKSIDSELHCSIVEPNRYMEIASIKEIDSETTAELIQKQILSNSRSDTPQPLSEDWQESLDNHPIAAELQFLENERVKVLTELEAQKQLLGAQLVRNELYKLVTKGSFNEGIRMS